jgi:hypothetical protein
MYLITLIVTSICPISETYNNVDDIGDVKSIKVGQASKI